MKDDNETSNLNKLAIKKPDINRARIKGRISFP